MKEISFRGKRMDNGEWVDGYFADMGNKACIIKSYEAYWDESCKAFRCHPSEIIPVDFSTVGQFIGLIDKNGKKIYEGDIIRWRDTDNYLIERTVVYDPEWNRFCVWINGAESFGVNKHLSNDIEIIGHKFDKQESLNSIK